MSQHGCPERLSNRSKAFQEDGPTQPTMELMVETLTGTAFEMTVSPSDTIFAIKSKIFRVEGIPVSQQHLLYNMRELDDAMSLSEHSIGDGAKLRLVLGLRGGPMATRRLPPPEPWRDIERLLHPHRADCEWGGSSSDCKVTVLVFREGERVNMVRVRENRDGSYSPLEHTNYESSLNLLDEPEPEPDVGPSVHQQNEVTMIKMMELRRRMVELSLQRRRVPCPDATDEEHDMQKTRSEETLSVPSLLDDPPDDEFSKPLYARCSRQYSFAQMYDRYRYDYDCGFGDRYTLLPPIGTRTQPDQPVQDADERLKLSDALAGSILVKAREGREEDGAILEECLDTEEFIRQDSTLANNLTPVPTAEYSGVGVGGAEAGGSGGVGGWRAFGSSSQLAPPPLAHALFSSSTSDLEALRRNRILPALSRHRNREHLHLSDEGLDLPRRDPPRSLVVGSERRRRNATSLLTPLPAAATTSILTPPITPPILPTPLPSTVASSPETLTEKQEKPEKKIRLRCGFCKKRLSIATVHKCRCGAQFCAPHRYAEVHGCSYDYKQQLPAPPPLARLPRI